LVPRSPEVLEIGSCGHIYSDHPDGGSWKNLLLAINKEVGFLSLATEGSEKRLSSGEDSHNFIEIV
jgi:hypothetical protein